MGTLVTAELVQRLTGRPIREVLRREVFEPLDLEDIALGSRGLDRQRLVRVEVPEYQIGSDFGWNSRYWQEFGAPWGGAFASPEDLAVICQLMLGDGQVRGTRLLAPGAPFLELSQLAGWGMYDGNVPSGGLLTGVGLSLIHI